MKRRTNKMSSNKNRKNRKRLKSYERNKFKQQKTINKIQRRLDIWKN